MKYIAHRGLVDGPNKQFENQPSRINNALKSGYDAEIDLWVVDDRLYLGHDEPQYNITTEFLHQAGLWIHAKSLNTLHWLTVNGAELNYFWHENDSYTLTSKGYIWAFPGKMLSDRSVMVMPEHVDIELNTTLTADCYAICSDYVERIKNARNKQK
jgi:hypothetical protein